MSQSQSQSQSLPRKKLEEAEAQDGYLAAIGASDINSLARKGTSYTPFFVEPETVDPVLRIIEGIELLDGSDILLMHPTADNGFPHTRPKELVCLPAKVIGSGTESLAETLRHEAIHLHQRRKPDLWMQTCRKDGWSAITAELLPAHLRLACRINPDTFRPTPFWAWEDYTVPLPLFIPKPNLSLSDCVVKWYDLRNGVLYRDPPSSFKGRYGHNPPQSEHPYELLAVELAKEGIQSTYELESKLLSK